jgi:high-affinity iron transporter
MLGAFLITFREGLEAFLLVGIMLSYLDRMNASAQRKYIYYGVGAGLVVSLVIAFAFQVIVSQFENEFYERVLMIFILLFASGMLSYMAIWMQRQARAQASAVERQLAEHISTGNLLGMVSLAFAAVLREGFETVLFLSALNYASPGGVPLEGGLVGGVLGIASSIALVWLLLRGSRRVPLRLFFKYTSLLILVIAGGLLGSAVNQMEALGWLPPLVPRIFDISWILDDRAGVGVFMRALFGYNAAPSLLQFAVWSGYLMFFLWMWRRSYAPVPREAR